MTTLVMQGCSRSKSFTALSSRTRHGGWRGLAWHGPARPEPKRKTSPTAGALQVMNREERQVHGDGENYWDANWTETAYSFKCLAPE